MRYRFTNGRPGEVKYRDDVIHFRAMQLNDYRWHLLAIKGRPPRRERAPLGKFVSLFSAPDLPALWEMEKQGFETKTLVAEKILERLVKDGLAETAPRKRT